MNTPSPATDHSVLAALAKPGRRGLDWHRRWYVLAFCFGPLALMLGLVVITGELTGMVAGQIMMAAGTWSALRLLSDRPLLNPIQGIVFAFHIWFGVGPAVCSAFYLAVGNADKFAIYFRGDMATLAIVAAGLPLYALAAAFVLQVWPGRWRARFLEPAGLAFAPRTLLAYALAGGSVYLGLFGLERAGIQAFESVNYLGGTVSTSPVLAAFAALSQLASVFALYGFFHAWYADPASIRRYIPAGLAGMAILVGLNLFSGSKGMVVFIVAVPILLCMTFRQRPPFVSMVAAVLGYILVLQPFVDSARAVSEIAKITTPEQRTELFKEYMGSGGWSVDRLSRINMESPFRYMFAAASRVTPQAEEFRGPWEGQSLEDGLSSVVPRFLSKDKADSNMGNFFARELGLAHPHNFMHNVTITVPFEMVGNYGWVAGVLSFGVMGLLFASGCAWLLSRDRLATHPLAPMTILMLLKVEASCGQFVNGHKGFPVVLAAAWGIWVLLGRRL